MRKVLPEKGVTFIEVPRMAAEGEIISSLLIQKYLEIEDYDKAFSLVPASTQQYLAKQL